MMKKLLAAAVLLASSNVALAEDSAGCGLGSMLFAGKSGPFFKSLAVTTNGFYGTNTFAVTSGTLGCQSAGVISSPARLGMFTGSNLDNLARDMSVGRGESLNTLADLMGVKDADKARFFQAAKANFGKIFAPANQNAGDMLASLDQVLAQDAVLAQYVTKA